MDKKMARIVGPGVCLILITLGAILAWGLPETEGLYFNVIGLIMVTVGVVGIPATLIGTAFFTGRNKPKRDTPRRRHRR
jgi:hypothetical protein